MQIFPDISIDADVRSGKPYITGTRIDVATVASLIATGEGREGVTHHVLRHTGASAMVAAGISLRVVQDIGGWSTLRMLERYAHPSGAEMSRAVRVLAAYTATVTKPAQRRNREKRSEEARTRKRCEEGRYGLASPTGLNGSWKLEICELLRAA